MIERIIIDPKNPRRVTCRIFGQSSGRGFFADVTISVNCILGNGTTKFSGNEFSWLKDDYGPEAWEWPICREYRNGAVFGVQWARDHADNQVVTKKADITIERIGALVVDTDYESCAYAACMATWTALGIEGAIRPSVNEGSITFPTL